MELSIQKTIMLLREVLSQKTHVAAHGYKQESFNVVADILFSNEFDICVDLKSIRDRHERVQRCFDATDKSNAKLSSAGGERSEIN